MDSLPFKVRLPTCSDIGGPIPSAPSQNDLALAILHGLERGAERTIKDNYADLL